MNLKNETATLSGLSNKQTGALIWTAIFLTLVYAVVLCGLLYNVYVYLYKERFSKIMSVSLFYTFTVTTVVLRIAGYIDLLCLSRSVHKN